MSMNAQGGTPLRGPAPVVQGGLPSDEALNRVHAQLDMLLAGDRPIPFSLLPTPGRSN